MAKDILLLFFHLASLWMLLGATGAWTALFVKGQITVEEAYALILRGPMGWPRVFKVWRAIRLGRKLSQHDNAKGDK